jgi:hypothetical protein
MLSDDWALNEFTNLVPDIPVVGCFELSVPHAQLLGEVFSSLEVVACAGIFINCILFWEEDCYG